MHKQPHKSHRTGWLRAAVLGANDGLVSTASLIIGVAAAGAEKTSILIAGMAGLVAGAMSMAAGEYVSVSSQSDAEKADIEMEKRSLQEDYEQEDRELSQIYMDRGLSSELAQKVAKALMKHDALGAHTRDDIGLYEQTRANPIQAALFSACTFVVGAGIPVFAMWWVAAAWLIDIVAWTSLCALAVLGGLAANLGGANVLKGAIRVVFWGAMAMIATALVGWAFGVIA